MTKDAPINLPPLPVRPYRQDFEYADEYVPALQKWVVDYARAAVVADRAGREDPARLPLILTRYQLRCILEPLDDDDTEIGINYFADSLDPEGEPMPAGLYMWLTDYPEEGRIGPLAAAPSPITGEKG